MPDAPPASSSSNRPATPSDAPPAATPEGLREAIANRFKAFWGPPVVGHMRHMERAVARYEQAARDLTNEALIAIDAAGYAVVPKAATEEMLRTAKMRSTSQETARGDLYRGIYAAMLAAGRVMP